MNRQDDLSRENQALRDRLSRLSEASLRINESLDFDTVLQDVLDSARSLTQARCGIVTLLDESGRVVDSLTSRMYLEESGGVWGLGPEAWRIFDYFSSLMKPIRIGDLLGHIGSMCLPEFDSHVPEGSPYAFLAAPVFHRGERVGNFFLGDKEHGGEFTEEDEETLVMFASQAALVISNARRYREEQRARTDLETLINTSPVGVVVFDGRTGAPVSFNREATRIVESLREPDESPEHLLETLTVRRADGREMSLEELPMTQVLSSGESARAEEIALSVPDGRSVTALVNASPIRSEDGEVETLVVTLQDMTPLEEIERLRAEFLAMVSHELRVPLTSIKGSTDTLLESFNSLDPAEAMQFLRIIKSQADRMRDLIAELLDVARTETGTLSVFPEPVEVGALVDEARNTFQSGGGRDKIAIDLEPDLPRVMADRRRIAQVLGNLLTNAARYSQAISTIQVNASLEGNYVAFSVADNGRGVPPDKLPFLFMKFSRIEDDGERRITDTGLGLAICKGIVEAHGGRIWAESDGLGLGTKFTFTLPVTDEIDASATRQTHRGPGSSRRASKGQARILVVDDDPMTLRYVRDALAGAGFVPLVTTDPNEALRVAETERPRLALLDLMLPGRDGIELMKLILEIVDMPVIFVSAYGRDEIIARAIDSGAVDYIVKPFSSTELVARVRGALRRGLGSSRGDLSEPFILGDLTIDYAERRVSLAGTPVQMTPTEYELLFELSVNAGRVLTFDTLLNRVWGMGHTGNKGSVRTYVKRLRRKLGDNAEDPKYIFAEPRVGYRMEKP